MAALQLTSRRFRQDPQAGKAAGDKVPPPATHLRNAAAGEKREPQDRLGDAGTFQHLHHPDTYSHVLPDMQDGAARALEGGRVTITWQ